MDKLYVEREHKREIKWLNIGLRLVFIMICVVFGSTFPLWANVLIVSMASRFLLWNFEVEFGKEGKDLMEAVARR